MRLSQRISLAVGSLVALQLLASGAAIGLLARMGPAIEGILEGNEITLRAVTEMLDVLAEAEGGPVLPVDRYRYQAALAAVDQAVVESDEQPTVERLRADSPAALEGDRAARVRVLAALERLGDRNLRSMHQEDLLARQLGVAGAWSVVALGVASVGFGVFVRRRIAQEIEDPIEEMDATLAEIRGGDPHRRVPIRPDLAAEITRVGQGVNDLLDRRQPEGTQRALKIGTTDRTILLHLLDKEPVPVVVVDARGELVISNEAANELFVSDSGARQKAALQNVPTGGRPEGWAITKVDAVWLCRRRDDLASRLPDASRIPEAGR